MSTNAKQGGQGWAFWGGAMVSTVVTAWFGGELLHHNYSTEAEGMKARACAAGLPRGARENGVDPNHQGLKRTHDGQFGVCTYEGPNGLKFQFKTSGKGLPPLVEAPVSAVSIPASAPVPAGR